MRRREFITLIGGAAAAWPVVGRAQQRVLPVVGVLCAGTAQALERYLASFREGMRRLGYIEGSNVRFEFRRHSPVPLAFTVRTPGILSISVGCPQRFGLL